MRRNARNLLTAALAILAARPAPGADSPDATPTVIPLRGCMIEFDRSALLGATNPGVLQDCLVRPGDRVRAKQVLGRLADGDVRAELALKKAEAESDIEIRLSRAKHAQAIGKLKRSGELSKMKYLSPEELSLHRLEADTAALGIEEAEYHRRQAEVQRRQVEAALHAREFVAPHDGVVVSVYKSEGESVAMNDPVFRLVSTDRLRVTGHLDVGDVWRVRRGQGVRVSVDIPGVELAVEREVFLGRVVFVDNQVDAETRVCKVVAEVDNRDDVLKAGLHAQMEILPESAPVAAAPAPSPAPAVSPAAALPTAAPATRVARGAAARP